MEKFVSCEYTSEDFINSSNGFSNISEDLAKIYLHNNQLDNASSPFYHTRHYFEDHINYSDPYRRGIFHPDKYFALLELSFLSYSQKSQNLAFDDVTMRRLFNEKRGFFNVDIVNQILDLYTRKEESEIEYTSEIIIYPIANDDYFGIIYTNIENNAMSSNLEFLDKLRKNNFNDFLKICIQQRIEIYNTVYEICCAALSPDHQLLDKIDNLNSQKLASLKDIYADQPYVVDVIESYFIQLEIIRNKNREQLSL